MQFLTNLRNPALAIALAILTGCALESSEESSATEGSTGDRAPSRNTVSSRPAQTTPATPTQPKPVIDDSLRMPDFLVLPTERDLRPTPTAPSDEGSGVTVRPPVED